MFQKINKLRDLLLGLLHACHISELHLDVSQSFNLEALLIGNLRDDRVRCEFPEDEEGNRDTEEGSDQA